MLAYIVRRLLLIIPTLFGIMIINFLVINVAPGGPIDQLLTKFGDSNIDVTARVSGIDSGELRQSGGNTGGDGATSRYRGAQGLEPAFIEELEKQFGFDKPLHERFLLMMGNYLRFDFGESYFRDRSVIDLVIEKLPVSISLGLWTTLLTYLISIPLGIRKAVHDGEAFDIWTSFIIIIGNAVPSFLFAIFLIVVFAGGGVFDWFPLRGLVSNNWAELSWPDRIIDYFWHLALPLLSLMIGAFAGLTILTKNSFLEHINMQYVQTARAKGLTESQVLYGHVFRNAMLIVIAGFPGAFIGILFTGAMLVEIIFSLDGLGLLGYEAALKRDYPVMFASFYIFGLIGLVMHLITDITYVLIDPRIDFESRES